MRYRYDIFISHAFEDQDEIGQPLYDLLHKAGFRIWYSGIHMSIGEALTPTIIKKVIPNARFSVVIISPNYFNAEWGHKELKAILARPKRKPCILLPVWHKVTEEEVRRKFPELVEMFAVSSDEGINYVISQLIIAINQRPKPPSFLSYILSGILSAAWLWLAALTTLLFIITTVAWVYVRNPFHGEVPEDIVTKDINQRIAAFQNRIKSDLSQTMNLPSPPDSVNLENLLAVIDNYTYGENGCSTNSFHIETPSGIQSGPGKVRDILGSDPITGIYSCYGIDKPSVMMINDPVAHRLNAVIINNSNCKGVIKSMERVNETQLLCTVRYTERLRFVKVSLEASASNIRCNHMEVSLLGIRAEEVYVYEKRVDDWIFTGVKQPQHLHEKQL